MKNDASKLSYIQPYDGKDVIYVGNRNSLPISHSGDACVTTTNGKLNLKDVLLVPNLKKKLLSVGKFTVDNSCIFKFISSGFVVKDRKQKMIARGSKKRHLYALDGNYQEAYTAIKKDFPQNVADNIEGNSSHSNGPIDLDDLVNMEGNSTQPNDAIHTADTVNTIMPSTILEDASHEYTEISPHLEIQSETNDSIEPVIFSRPVRDKRPPLYLKDYVAIATTSSTSSTPSEPKTLKTTLKDSQ